MKSFIISALFFLLSSTVFAQTTFIKTLTNGSDTVKVWDLSKQYTMVYLTIENLSASIACTLQVRGVSYIRNTNDWQVNDGWQHSIIDTTYSKIMVIDDTRINVASLIVPSSSAITYWLPKDKLEGVKVYLTNTTGGNCRAILEASP